jgi:flagellar protein FlgJ
LRQAARQFEGMLLHLMLKSMRDANAAGGLLDSDQSRFFTAIGDQQMAQDLASQAPLGFAAMIEKQLARQMTPSTAVPATSPLDLLQQSLSAQITANTATLRSVTNAQRSIAAPPMVKSGAVSTALGGLDDSLDRTLTVRAQIGSQQVEVEVDET